MDWEAVSAYETEFNADLVDRLLTQLQLLDEKNTPYPVNRYQHSLQSATRALNDDGARYARDKYRDSPLYEARRYFCHHYDQNAFNPIYRGTQNR